MEIRHGTAHPLQKLKNYHLSKTKLYELSHSLS